MAMFEQKRSWIDHEMEQHRRSWSCLLCKFTSAQQSEVTLHVEQRHPETLGDEPTRTMTYMTSRPLDSMDASRCPFCDWDKVLLSKSSVTTVSRESFMSHLAHHLEQLALFAIPRIGSDNNSGSLNSNLAANRGSQASQGTEDSNSMGERPSIGVANTTREAPTEVASSPVEQSLDSKAASFTAIGLAFPSQPQDLLAWTTQTDRHDLEVVTGLDAEVESSSNDPYMEIQGIYEHMSHISAKVAAVPDHIISLIFGRKGADASFETIRKYTSPMSHEFEKAIEEVVAKLKACGFSSSRDYRSAVLDHCVTVMSESKMLLIMFRKTNSHRETRRISEEFTRTIRNAQDLLTDEFGVHPVRLPADEELLQDEETLQLQLQQIELQKRELELVLKMRGLTRPKSTSQPPSLAGVETLPSLESTYHEEDEETLQLRLQQIELQKRELELMLKMRGLTRSKSTSQPPSLAGVETLPSLESISHDQDAAKREELMTELSYPGMGDRWRAIPIPLNITLDRIYEGLGPIQHWLSSEHSVFWITGKPGSGKSTLMLMLGSDRRTQEHLLRGWADVRIPYILSFHFHGAGSTLQKSTEGLLRCLLFQLIQYAPIWMYSTIATKIGPYDDWTTEDLRSALKEALGALPPRSVVLFVDGLDEFDSSQDDLIELLALLLELQALGSVKICVASRPSRVIQDCLGVSPHLILDDLFTAEGITAFVRARLANLTSERVDKLAWRLVERSEGSFVEAAFLLDQLEPWIVPGTDEKAMLERLIMIRHARRLEQT